MQTIRRKPRLSEQDLNALEGSFADPSMFDHVIGRQNHPEPLELLDDETGEQIAVWIPHALSVEFCSMAYRALHDAASVSKNRGTASGSKSRSYQRADGSLSTTHVADPVMSAIIGFYDRYPRQNYCRVCAWNSNNPEAWAQALPMIQAISRRFSEYVPDKWAYQQGVAERVKSCWLIPETVFSTVTVNKNFRTAIHRDGLNLRNSFSAFNVLRAGRFLGGQLVFPRYGVAFHADNQDLLFFKPQEPHGNTDIKPFDAKPFERMSFVYYLREKMTLCGTVAEELERGKRKHGQLELD